MSNGPSTFYIKQGSTTPAYTATIYDANGSILNLTGASVNFQCTNEYAGNVVNAAATITNAVLGQVSYSWASADTSTPGLFSAEWKVTLSGGGTYIYPNNGYALIQIQNDITLGYPALQPGGIWNTIRNAARTPTNTDGNNNDFWLNTATYNLYGPKSNGIWPVGFVSLTGAATSGYNVKNPVFGAVGNGITDDTTAFQNALNLAGASTPTGASSSVLVPPGVYLVGPLTIPHRVELRGSGVGSTTLLCKVGAAAGPFISAASHAEMITIRDMRLQGNSLNGSQTNVINGVQLGGSWTYNSSTDEYNNAHHRLLNVHIEYFTGDGVVDSGTHHKNIINQVQVAQVKGNGFNLGDDNSVSNCYATNCQLDGFLVTGNSLLSNCTAALCGWYNGTSFVTSGGTTTGSGFRLTATSSTSLSNCYAQDNGRSGFYFNGAFNGNYLGITVDSNNNNSSSTTFSGIDMDSFAGPLNMTAFAFDRNANTQHQASALNIANSSPPNANNIMLTVQLGAQMTAVFSAATTAATIALNNITVTNGSQASLYGNVGLGGATSFAGGANVVGLANATTAPTSSPTGGVVKYATAGFAKYRGIDGSDYQDGICTLYNTGTQNIASTTPTNVTGLGASVAATRYMVIGSLVFTAGVTAAAQAVFSFTGPTATQVALVSEFQGPTTIGYSGPAQITTLAGTATSPNLTTTGGVYIWEFKGIVQFSATGTLQVQAKEGTNTDTFTIQAGSYFLLIPLV